MNEPDAYALEEALRLKRSTAAKSSSARPVRRGSRRSSAKRSRAAPIAPSTSKTMAWPCGCLRRGRRARRRDARRAFDLILTGLQSDDQGFAQTGVILAERLGLPHATIIMEVPERLGRPGQPARCA